MSETDMTNEAKPNCPHCGSDLIPVDGEAYECGQPWCGNVNVMPLEFWNRRLPEDALRAKLKIAIEALEECRRFCNEFDYEPTYNDIENIDKALAKLKE